MTQRKVPITQAEMASRGGDARARALTPERRAEIAKAAAASRWTRRAPADVVADTRRLLEHVGIRRKVRQ